MALLCRLIILSSLAFWPGCKKVEHQAKAAQAKAPQAKAPQAKAGKGCPDGATRVGDAPPKGYSRGCIKDGKQHGKVTRWHINRQKQGEGEFKDGKPHGKVTGWYETGEKKSEGEFRDGKPHGKWTHWNLNGQKKVEGEFKVGKMVR